MTIDILVWAVLRIKFIILFKACRQFCPCFKSVPFQKNINIEKFSVSISHQLDSHSDTVKTSHKSRNLSQ